MLLTITVREHMHPTIKYLNLVCYLRLIDVGPPAEWFQRLYHTWINGFEWTAVQDHLNRHAH